MRTGNAVKAGVRSADELEFRLDSEVGYQQQWFQQRCLHSLSGTGLGGHGRTSAAWG